MLVFSFVTGRAQATASCYTTFESKVNVLKKACTLQNCVFGGDIVQNVGGEPDELLCNNRGVDFVDAFADIELKELNLYSLDESLEGKLIPTKKQGVLVVQANSVY